MEKFENLISSAIDLGVSDVHITGGHPVVYRINGILKFQTTVKWNYKEVDALLETLLTPRQLNELRERYSIDCAMRFSRGWLRINVFYTTRGLSLAIRILPGIVPTIEQLNLHPSLKEICKLKSGLVLICGATGVGKTTTIASLLEEINRNFAQHIITLEDPIEFRLISKKSFIEQRELGTHMPTFERGLLDVLREDPDVIVIGEVRDQETIKLMLNIAEAGHLIIATMHASNSEEALHRILNAFPMESQDDIRNRLASTLAWLVIQDMVFLDKFGFRVPLLSILRSSQSLKGTIREDKLHQIENIIQLGKNEGMFNFDRYLNEYLMSQNFLTPPLKLFQPSTEKTEGVDYRSPIMDSSREPLKRYPKDKKRITEPASPSPESDQVTTFSNDGRSLKDLIEELDKEYK